MQHLSEAPAIRSAPTPGLTGTDIAPRPEPVENEYGNDITPQSALDYEDNKAELRKIRKREAAARFYRRKLAAKSRSER